MAGFSNYSETLADSADNSMFYHSTFRRNWRRTLEREHTIELPQDWINYSTSSTIRTYTNLKGVLKKMDLHPDDRDKNRSCFKEFVNSLPQIKLIEAPAPFTWYNTTTNGINLRPGRLGGSNRLPHPVVMAGENTHGIVAGTTGSGKSVFLNNLILNLMVEYPPWELELYLADFKKVEMSRYMNKYEAPHVRACAATSEIEYVQSLIRYIKDRMDDRQKLFSRLGYTDIEGFRAAFPELAVPRILFLVDEFQQLFLDATSSQKSVIEDLITNITRLGRAQGVHLLFASQDMSGALNQKQLSNFNVRFALLCDAAISDDILGNSEATRLKRGQVIAKTKTTSNETYDVPIAIDPDDSKKEEGQEEYFFRLLKEFVDDAEKFQYLYRNTQKFYDEDKQLELDALETLLNNPKIKSVRSFIEKDSESSRNQNFMSLVLGRKVVYSNAAYDIENIFIDYSKNRSLLCLSSNNIDLAYFQKLIALNIRTMLTNDNGTIDSVNLDFGVPFFYDLSPLVSTFYPEEERIKDLLLKDPHQNYSLAYKCSEEEIEDFKNRYFHYRAEELEELFDEYDHRKLVLEILRNGEIKNAKESCMEFIRHRLIENEITDEDEINYQLNIVNESGLSELKEDDSNILEFIKKVEFIETDMSYMRLIRSLLEAYYRYHIAKIRPAYKIFAPLLVWITGIENLERIPNWLPEFSSNAMDYNFFVMYFSAAPVKYDIKQTANYIFVSGFDPKLYDDYVNKKMAIGENGLKFHALVKNTNQQFAFKKYRCKLNEAVANSIDFDHYLVDD